MRGRSAGRVRGQGSRSGGAGLEAERAVRQTAGKERAETGVEPGAGGSAGPAGAPGLTARGHPRRLASALTLPTHGGEDRPPGDGGELGAAGLQAGVRRCGVGSRSPPGLREGRREGSSGQRGAGRAGGSWAKGEQEALRPDGGALDLFQSGGAPKPWSPPDPDSPPAPAPERALKDRARGPARAHAP